MKRSIVGLIMLCSLVTGFASAQGTLTRVVSISVSGGTPQELYIDNVLHRPTAYPYKVKLPMGNHEIIARAAGFKEANVKFLLNKDMDIKLDLSPLTQTPQSGKEIYKISVVSDTPTAQFFINDKPMGKVNNSTELFRGTYQLRVVASGFPDYRETINLDQNKTITVNFKPQTFNLTVVANITSAQVSINNVTYGNVGTPYVLAPGTYVVTVNAPGYSSYSETVVLNSDRVLAVNLKSAVFLLTINSNVKNAQVYLNDVLKTVTGSSISLAPGNYNLRVSAAGYADYEETISLTDNKTVMAQLKIKNYQLTIKSNVPNAQVYIDNRPFGQVGIFTLEPNEYVIKITAPGYVDGIYSINLNQDQVLNVQLKSQSFNFSVGTDVSNAQIYINDAFIGAGAAVTSLAPGTYVLKIMAPGYVLVLENIQLNGDLVKTYKLKAETGKLIFKVDKKFKSTIYIDNQRQKENDYEFELSKGMHVIRLVTEGGLEAVVSINIEPGKVVTISPIIQLKVE